MAAAAIAIAAGAAAGHAQAPPANGVPSQPWNFTKQALDANGAPLSGPVSVGQTINYVLIYKPGTSPSGPVTIDDTLSANLVYVNPSIVAPPGWTWTLPGYVPGNHEVYSNLGFGPGTSFIVDIPVADRALTGASGGDGFLPVPVANHVYEFYHHENYGQAQIHCLDLLSLATCSGSWPRSLGPARTTPMVVRTAVTGGRIYYPSARYDSVANRTYFGIGCWDTAPEAPCTFIDLPSTPSLPGKLEASGPPGSPNPSLDPHIAGVAADPANPNHLFMFAVDKVYCVDVTPATPVPCNSWLSPTLAGSGSQILDIMAGEGTGQLYVQYGITNQSSGNRATVACLEMASGSRCALWLSDPQAPVTDTVGHYGTLSPALNPAGGMIAVCLHPYVTSGPGGALKCFNVVDGGDVTNNPTIIPTPFVTAMNNTKITTAFHIPGKKRVLYARYTSSMSCYDFDGSGTPTCVSFAPAWTNFSDYGYAVDPAAPNRCLLGLGHAGIVWRFTHDGGFDLNGCMKPVEAKVDINSFFCAIKPKEPRWGSIIIKNRPAQLTGGTINLASSSGPIIPAISVGTANTYAVNISATGANSQLTLQFTPVYTGQPTAGYQLELTFTADVDPQICYKATVQECGPVSNNATMAGSIVGPAAPVPVSATAGVNLGNATGPRCEPGLLKVCKVAGTGITVGTPFNFTISTSTSHGVLSVPAGPAPGGTCMVGPTYPVGTQVAVTEAPMPGNTVSSIAVAPQGQLVNTNLAGGGVTVTIGMGVTEVTFTDKRTGFLEICKRGDVRGTFSFMVNPGNLGPFAVPAGACSPAIEVAAGSVTIHELTTGANIIACSTIPASQQGPCNIPPGSQNSVVTVVPGDISTMTIAFITNRQSRGTPVAPDRP